MRSCTKVLGMPSFDRNPKDFLTGLVFIAFGAAFLLIAHHYHLGTARPAPVAAVLDSTSHGVVVRPT